MELTLPYILSQVFIIINYALLAISYYCKDRKTVLVISFMAVIANGLSYVFLNAYSGLAMCILLSVVGTMFYTYSVWQKKTIIYKFMGIPVGISWIIYNIYIMSIFGIILESILLVSSTIGYILEVKEMRKS